jgi:hypothetical protein
MARLAWVEFRQWDFVADMNHDGLITISDVGLWFKWLYFYPGDGLIAIIGPTALGQFLELNTGSFGGFGSGVMSFFGWIIGFSIVDSGFNLLSAMMAGIDRLAERLSRPPKTSEGAVKGKSERAEKGYDD